MAKLAQSPACLKSGPGHTCQKSQKRVCPSYSKLKTPIKSTNAMDGALILDPLPQSQKIYGKHIVCQYFR